MTIDYSLYLITDRGILGDRDICDAVEEAIENGVTVVQLREKTCTTREFYDIGRRVLQVTRSHGVPLIINDRLDIMLALDADGVHVGPKDLPLDRVMAVAANRIVGCSVNCLDDLQAAQRHGVSYVGMGPVFPTSTKPDTRDVLGLDGLRLLATRADLPSVAIGGITPERAADVRNAGVNGVCAISAILGAPDIGAAARAFVRAV